jgi:uncharacterized iron-regulated membrane protein
VTRSLWVWLHRWVGLMIAGFLVIVGLTGSLLAFWLEVNHWLTPELYPGERPGVALDIASLVQHAEAIVPQARVTSVYEGYPGSVMIGMEATEGAPALGFDFLHLDPIDGHERGRVSWTGLPRHRGDVMPFIYALHMHLALEHVGHWILGLVALAWTVDCFVSFYLTLPPPAQQARKSFLARWRTSWVIKMGGSFFRANFDIHRASGLWLWPLLFVFAWSSVFFSLPDVYASITGTLFDYVGENHHAHDSSPQEQPGAPMDWGSAQATGRRLIAVQAKEKGFNIDREVALYRVDDGRAYDYRVHSSLDIGERGGGTAVTFDARSGALRNFTSPTGAHSGDTITTWLVELHTANVFGLPYRIFVCILGLLIVTLSITGVYIWWKKRRSRRLHRAAAVRVNSVVARETI